MTVQPVRARIYAQIDAWEGARVRAGAKGGAMEIDPVVVGVVILFFLAAGMIWAIMAGVLWVLDRVDGWIHRRDSRRRPWR